MQYIRVVTWYQDKKNQTKQHLYIKKKGPKDQTRELQGPIKNA